MRHIHQRAHRFTAPQVGIGAALEKRGSRATIVGATSGDTGAAAIEAFGGGAGADVFILFPHGRVSDVQRRQMTTVDRPGVHAIAIEGAGQIGEASFAPGQVWYIPPGAEPFPLSAAAGRAVFLRTYVPS